MQTDPTPAEARAAEAMADAVADALAQYAVAYTHVTLADMSTAGRSWKVHETGHGNPFDHGVWLGEFDNKAEADALCAGLRRKAAVEAASQRLTPSTDARSRGQAEEREDIAAIVDPEAMRPLAHYQAEWAKHFDEVLSIGGFGDGPNKVDVPAVREHLARQEYDQFGHRRATALKKADAILAAIRSGETPVGEGQGIDLGDDQWNRIAKAAADDRVSVPVATFVTAAQAWRWLLSIVPQSQAVAERAAVLERMFVPPTDVADIAASLLPDAPAAEGAAPLPAPPSIRAGEGA